MRADKGIGTYRAFDTWFEIEYGITDRFQTSTYFMFDGRNQSGLDPADYQDISGFRFDGVQQEFIYNIASTYTNPVGISLYLEPGWSRYHKISGEEINEFEIETMLILQKNWLDDTLISVLNIRSEAEWYYPKGGGVDKEFTVEVTGGLTYRFARGWYFGVEGRYHTEFPEYGAQEHGAYFVGPNLHWAGRKWWATLTWLPQVYGWPNDGDHQHGDHQHGDAMGDTPLTRTSQSSGDLHFGEHERYEIRLKCGYNFGVDKPVIPEIKFAK
jgi:hypothetical protein